MGGGWWPVRTVRVTLPRVRGAGAKAVVALAVGQLALSVVRGLCAEWPLEPEAATMSGGVFAIWTLACLRVSHDLWLGSARARGFAGLLLGFLGLATFGLELGPVVSSLWRYDEGLAELVLVSVSCVPFVSAHLLWRVRERFNDDEWGPAGDVPRES